MFYLDQANEILSSFDVSLRQYAQKHLTKVIRISLGNGICFIHISLNFSLETLYQSGVRLVKGVVKEVHPRKLVLSDGSDVPYGLLVWSTGVGPSEFVKSLNLPKSPGGRYTHLQFSQVNLCLFSLFFATKSILMISFF